MNTYAQIENHNCYKTDLRDFLFLINEQFQLPDNLFRTELFNQCTPDAIDEILKRSRNFAYQTLGPSYKQSDEDSCHLVDGKVEIPSDYRRLWQAFQQEWGTLSAPEEHGGFGVPPVVMQMMLEMFMGANPSFMTYGGFCRPSSVLVEKYGNDLQKFLFSEKLSRSEWTSCLCLTEPQAGSDVALVETKAAKQTDGSYLLTGEKYLISAGMHDLTDNTIYFVLGRGENSGAGTYGLSCFIVPKFWVNEDGSIGEFNHVECIELADKMGFKGCANTHLTFGANGPCKAYLLGERENVGLIQFLTLMNQARISTGVYALGMASSAYHNALEYAQNRVQGKRFHESFNPRADRVNIIEHVDVQRMLLEMKSKVEGCRALIAKLSLSESLMLAYQHDDSKKELVSKHQGMMNLLTPVVKAYVSDQAWRICELAIQTCGGQGYLKQLGIEQYARDVKVLSIWEGTNFIQSQDLLRDKLGLGNQGKLYKIYQSELEQFLQTKNEHQELQSFYDALESSIHYLDQSLALIHQWVKQKRLDKVPQYSTRVLHMMGEVTLAWLLLDGACAAYRALKQNNIDSENSLSPEESHFYQGKIASAQFFIFNILPNTKITLATMQNDASYVSLTGDVWSAIGGKA